MSVCGVDPATRGPRMDEGLTIVRQLLTGSPVTFHGAFFDLDEALILPAPAAPIPIIIRGPLGRRDQAGRPGSAVKKLLASRHASFAIVAPRFCGPPDSANGGHASGLIAACLDGQAEITLRRPPPLARPMAVERDGEGSVRVLDGDVLIAEGTSLPGSLAVDLPGPVTVRDARAAGLGSRLRAHPDEHPFPTCFVCGPARRPAPARSGRCARSRAARPRCPSLPARARRGP